MNFSNTPSFISHGPRPGLRLTLAVATSIALLFGDARLGLMGPAREALSVALYPLQWLVNAPISAAQHASEFFVDQARLKQENAALKTRELQLSAKLAELTTVKNELAELKAMNALRSQRAEKSVLAEVLYTGRDPFSYKLIIDKGQNAGLVEGQPVVGDSGLIGQVTRVQPLTAEVTLVINKGQMVPVMIERTGVRAILYGYGGGVELRYLPVHADLQAGDRLVTSGIDGVYPAGLPVSRVTRVERRAGAAFLSASSLPVDGVYRQRFVLVLETGAHRPPVSQPQP